MLKKWDILQIFYINALIYVKLLVKFIIFMRNSLYAILIFILLTEIAFFNSENFNLSYGFKPTNSSSMQDIQTMDQISGAAIGENTMHDAQTMDQISGAATNGSVIGLAAIGGAATVYDAQTMDQISGGAACFGVCGIQDTQTMSQMNGSATVGHTHTTGTSAGQAQDIKTMNQLSPNTIEYNNSYYFQHIASPLQSGNSLQDYQTIYQLNNTKFNKFKTDREKLIDKVSSEQELHTILDKFRNFADFYYNSYDGNIKVKVNENKTITTSNFSSTNVYYTINPQYTINSGQIIRENYSIIMLKFTDINNNLLNNPINYKITIQDRTTDSIIFTQNRFTNNGLDLMVIDENTFLKGDANNPASYQMWIHIDSLNGNNTVNEKTKSPITVKVI